MLYRKTNTGLATIVVIFMLSLMLVLGIGLVRVARLNAGASRNYSDKIHARLIASAGVEKAIAAVLQYDKNYESTDSPWYWDNDFAKAVTDSTITPSFNNLSAATNNGYPYSQIMPWGTYQKDGNFYVLKIISCASQININMQYRDPQRLMEILKNLGKAINDVDPPITSTMAQDIVNNRPAGGYHDKRDIVDLSAIDEDKYRRFKDYITVHSWQDPNSCWYQSDTDKMMDAVDMGPGEPGNYKKLRWNYGTLVREYRAPINVNTTPKPVLMAVFKGIQGFYVDTGTANSTRTGTTKLSVAVDDDKLNDFVDAIISRRQTQPFKHWKNFEDFVENGALSTTDTWTAPQKNALLANVNPNANINSMNLQASRYHAIDKFNVENHTTEICFSSLGFFEITSLGRILANNNVAAEAQVTAVVQIYQTLVHTSQADFENGGTFSNVISYPEAPLKRQPADLDAASAEFFGDGYLTLMPKKYQAPGSPAGVLSGNHLVCNFQNKSGASDIWNDEAGENPLDADSGGYTPFVLYGLYYARARPLFNNTDDNDVGHVLPDGAYAELTIPLAYEAPGNVGATKGIIMFWFKPAWELANLDFSFVSLSRIKDDNENTQTHLWGKSGNYYGCMTEPQTDGNPLFGENEAISKVLYSSVASDFVPNRWVHVAMAWDLQADGTHSLRNIYHNGVKITNDNYGTPDITAHDITGTNFFLNTANVLRMGEFSSGYYTGISQICPPGTVANLVSVSQYGSGDANTAAIIADAYDKGRYESSGDYRSVDFSPKTTRFRGVRWVAYFPTDPQSAATAIDVKIYKVGEGVPIFSTAALTISQASDAYDNTPGSNGWSTLSVTAGDQFYYRVYFDRGASKVETPIFDEIRISYNIDPKFLSWETR